MPNPVTRFQIASDRPAQLAAFYKAAFGWTTAARPDAGYTALHTNTGGLAGGIAHVPEGAAAGVALYVESDDLDLTLAKIEGSGGRRLTPVAALEPLGIVAMFADPEGHPMGLVEAVPDFSHHEYRVYGWPDPIGDGGVAHFEIMGRDPQTLVAFYRNVFGWHIDAADPEYALIDTHTIGIAGAIGRLDRPSSPVTFYVQAADLYDALDRVEGAGGKRLELHAPQFALFTDPDGNIIGLVPPQD